MLKYNYRKYKLSKGCGLAYPVNKSMLDHALDTAGVRELDDLYFSVGLRDEDQVVMLATLRGESHSGYWQKEMPRLGVSAVPLEILAEVRGLLEQSRLLEKIAKWIAGLEGASNVIRDVTRHRVVVYRDGALQVKDENGKRVELP